MTSQKSSAVLRKQKLSQKKHPLLKSAYPAIYAQIDFEAAALLGISKTRINKLTGGSGIRIPFMCTKAQCGCVHRWTTYVQHRVRGNSCPGCSPSGDLACLHNNAAIKYPHIVDQYHPTKNTAELHTLRPSCNRMCHWICSCTHCGEKHEWMASVINRTNKNSGCPYCNGSSKKNVVCRCQSLGTLNPNLCEQINVNLSPPHDTFTITRKSPIQLWWNCVKVASHRPWKARVNDRARPPHGQGCPTCVESKLEKSTALSLTANGLQFDREYRFPDTTARYDFAVHTTKGMFLIEVDGRQHFEGVNYNSTKFTKEDCFMDNVRRDYKKDAYARKMNTDLLRIPYTKFGPHENISDIINGFIQQRRVHTDSLQSLVVFIHPELYVTRDHDFQELINKPIK